MPYRGIAEQEGLHHALWPGCAGLPEPEHMGEDPDLAQGAQALEGETAWGHLPSLSQATPQPAPGAQMCDLDQSIAAGLFGGAGKAGYNLTNSN